MRARESLEAEIAEKSVPYNNTDNKDEADSAVLLEADKIDSADEVLQGSTQLQIEIQPASQISDQTTKSLASDNSDKLCDSATDSKVPFQSEETDKKSNSIAAENEITNNMPVNSLPLESGFFFKHCFKSSCCLSIPV